MARQVLPPDDAPGSKDRQGSDGPKAGDSFVLDDAQKWDYAQLKKFGSHAGQPGNRRGVQYNIE
jgi:hypothetical protein